MRKTGVLTVVLLIALFGGALQAGDLLDDLTRAVDELEGCFWRGYFHATGHPRRVRSTAVAEKDNRLSRAVQAKRANPNNSGIGNPTDASMKLLSLLQSSSYAGEYVYLPTLKSMNWSAFMREFQSQHPKVKGKAQAEIAREDYDAWLLKIGNCNASLFSRGLGSNQKITKLRRTRLLNVEQNYREALISLRLSIFDLRRSDPAFSRENKPQKSKKSR